MRIQSLKRCLLLSIALASATSQAGQYETGLIFATEEQLNSLPAVPRYRAYLPESVDLSYRFPRAGAQGNQGSCVGWAVAYGARSYYDFKLSQRTPDSKWTTVVRELPINAFPLFSIPILLRSKLCATHSAHKDLLYEMGECRNDQGGYFIIDGRKNY